MGKDESVNEESIQEASSKDVLKAFYDGNSANSKVITTNGKELMTTGIGGRTIAKKVGDKFEISVDTPSSKTEERVINALKKYIPSDLMENKLSLVKILKETTMNNYESKFKKFLTEGEVAKEEVSESLPLKEDSTYSIPIYGFNDGRIATTEAVGLSKVFDAYADTPGEDIMEIGFNSNSGYVYIALENGIDISSGMGQDVEYIVTDREDGEEFFLDSYAEAEDKAVELSNREDEE